MQIVNGNNDLSNNLNNINLMSDKLYNELSDINVDEDNTKQVTIYIEFVLKHNDVKKEVIQENFNITLSNKNRIKIVDNFERDNLEHYIGSLSEFEITDSISRVGNKCLRGFVSDNYDGWESIYSIDGLDYYPEPGQIFELYVYNDASQFSAASSFRFGVSDLNTDETTQITVRRRINRSDGSRARIVKNGDIIEEHGYSGSLDNKEWYRVVVKWPVEDPIEIDWYNDETGENNLHMELTDHQDINGGGIGFGRTYSGDEHFYDGFKIIDTI